MKNRIAILLAALALLSAPARPGAPAGSFTVNGLKVIFVPAGASDIVSANMYFRGGSSTIDLSQAGIEHLALQVATLATKSYPREKLNEELESMDSQISSAAGRDYASISLQCVKQNFARSWKIFADVILNPSFDTADVELERASVLSSIRQSEDDPDQYLGRLAMEAFYVNHPYSADPSGTEKTVRSFTAAELRSFMQARVTSSGMLLVVVGNTTREELEAMVKESFGAIPQGEFRASPPPAPVFQTPSLKVVRRDLPTKYITGYYPFPRYGTEESYAMMLAQSILYSRLFEEVRTKRGLSYAPGAGSGQVFTNYGLVYVTAVQPETTMTVIMDEVKKLQNEPVSDKTLNDQRNVYLVRDYLNIETNGSQANLLARYELSGAGYAGAEKYLEYIRKVTPADIQAACRKYMHNFQFVLLGNPGELRLAPFTY